MRTRTVNSVEGYTVTQPTEADMTFICHEANKYCLSLHNARPEDFLVARIGDRCDGFVRIVDHGSFFEIEGPFVRDGALERELTVALLRGILGQVTDRPVYIVSDLPETLESVGFEVAYDVPREIAIKTGPT